VGGEREREREREREKEKKQKRERESKREFVSQTHYLLLHIAFHLLNICKEKYFYLRNIFLLYRNI